MLLVVLQKAAKREAHGTERLTSIARHVKQFTKLHRSGQSRPLLISIVNYFKHMKHKKWNHHLAPTLRDYMDAIKILPPKWNRNTIPTTQEMLDDLRKRPREKVYLTKIKMYVVNYQLHKPINTIDKPHIKEKYNKSYEST